MKNILSISLLFFIGVRISMAQDSCYSSFEFRSATKSAANIIPSGSGKYHQLYDANGFTWEAWLKLNGPIINQSIIIITEDSILFQDIILSFGWGSTPKALSFLVSDDGTANATVTVGS